MKKEISLIILLIAFLVNASGQNLENKDYPTFAIHNPNFKKTKDSSFYQMKYAWNDIIDEFWGAGDPLNTKQSIFNQFADRNEEAYPCFVGLELDWESHRSNYYNQITETTSKGRFSAIMAHFAISLQELHARMWDLALQFTPLNPGTPVFILNPWEVTHFGASISSLPDSNLLVVNVVKNHPLDLEPGDIILGYEGVPWKNLTWELFNAQIPVGGFLGSNEKAINDIMLTNCGMNWHMFNTIDVIKFGTSDTLHLSTDLLLELDGSQRIFNNPQVPVSGISFPSYDPNEENGVSYGIIEGTNIGYIYVTKHNYVEVNPEFDEAIEALYNTDGLIIDIRLNSGGSNQLFDGLSKLFTHDVEPMSWLWRCNETDLYNLCQFDWAGWFDIQSEPEYGYTKPIAILTGPFTESFGDIFAYTLKSHPSTRFFGKPTNGAFSVRQNPLIIDGWYVSTPNIAVADSDTPDQSLVRMEFPIDHEVWLEPESVASGVDNVVEEAISWINDSLASKILTETVYNLWTTSYPNPFSVQTHISFSLKKSNKVQVSIYNSTGIKIRKLLNSKLEAGEHKINWTPEFLPGGIYYYKIQVEDNIETGKIIYHK